jgi:putative membrane-bound dehydrogenase-like protein
MCCNSITRIVIAGALISGPSWVIAQQPTKTESPTFQSPVSAEESLKLFQLADDRLNIEVVAAEPEIMDPVAAQFDEDGRLWVVEMADYPHGPARGQEPKSRIKVLQDLDGDGRFESVSVFADKLLFATELQPWQGGLIATLAGEVAYLKDTDGDGRADKKETWYKGFAQENSQLRANHPRLGLDGWVYVSNGLRGGTVVDARKTDSKRIPLAGKDFRFHPHSFDYEAVTGVGQYGLTFDEFGNRFICSNRNPLMHVVLEERHIARNPRYAPPAARHDVARAGEESRIYAISRAWTTSNLHAGQFTAACGVVIFRGDALPDGYYGNGLTCDPTGNLVHRERVVPAGATFTYEPIESTVEFLASPDEWFRPVNLFNGPDGALYVVDMYRAVIEHPDFMPDELKKRPDLPLGMDRGRIYRVATKNASSPAAPRLSQATSSKLVELLAKRGWYADTAHRLLYERQDKSCIEALRQAARTMPAVGAVRALWLLDGMDELNVELLSESLRHHDSRVREQAIQIADADSLKADDLRKQVAELTKDPDARVRFWSLLTLAPATTEGDLSAVKQGALLGMDDVWTRRATAIAAGAQASKLVTILLSGDSTARQAPSPAESELLRELMGLAATKIDEEQATKMLAAVLALPNDAAWQRLQRVLLRSFAEPLARQGKSLRQIADKLGDATGKTRFELILAAADTALSNPTAPLDERVEAIQLLGFDEQYADTLLNVALNREPDAQIQPAMRIQAVSALSRTAAKETWKTMLASWSRESAAFRRSLLDALFARPERLEILVDEIAAGHIRPNELELSYVNRLLKTGNGDVRRRAETLLASAIPADRQKVLADYQGVLKLKADSQRGREIFAKNCATCHRIGELGVNVAPDISDSRVKQPEQLLTDILQPNRAIDNNYVSYTVATSDGLTRTGIITAETANSVTLRQQEGKDATLARADIEDLRSNGISLMPEGLEKNIPPQEMADLISFIKNWRYLDGRTPVGRDGS